MLICAGAAPATAETSAIERTSVRIMFEPLRRHVRCDNLCHSVARCVTLAAASIHDFHTLCCNPATGEPIQIKASKKVAFRPAKELKEAV